jgi:AraC family transcriptional regulator
VTDVGLAIGFSETSSFTAAFRRATGLTPTGYQRSVM